MRIVNGKVFTDGAFVEQTVHAQGGRFSESGGEADGIVVEAQGCYVIPGLVDVHFHGCMGHDFCDATPEAYEAIARYEASRGVTAVCPATMTYPEEKLQTIMEAARAFEVPEDGADLVGINMEGPFISPDKIGAQNPAYVQKADAAMFRRLQEASGGLVKLVDIAPEEEGALAFVDEVGGDVRVSVAHTCAGYDTACAAFAHGARQLTHCYNAMPGLHHRKPGPIAAAFDHPDVTPEIIADGVHIHPSMVRLAFRIFGDNRVILISDSMEATGLEDGEYSLGGQPVTVRGNLATLHDGTIAGSATDLMACLRTAVKDMDIPLASAVKAASANPARAIGVDADYGSIEPGKIASCALLDEETLEVRAVILRGRVLR